MTTTGPGRAARRTLLLCLLASGVPAAAQEATFPEPVLRLLATLPIEARSVNRPLVAKFSEPNEDDLVWESRIDPEHPTATAVWARVRVLRDDGAVPWKLELVGANGTTWRGSDLEPGMPIWTGRVSGRTALLRVHADAIPSGLSLIVERVGFLSKKVGLESIVDTNDPKIEPFAGYANDEDIGPTGLAVAKLETWFDPWGIWSREVSSTLKVESDTSMLIPCTGFSIGRSTLVTAAHCMPPIFSEGSSCPNTHAFFDFDADDAEPEVVGCKRVLARPKGIDVVVLELADTVGKPRVLEPRGAAVAENDRLMIVHHPNGESKKVTVERCSVSCVAWSPGCPESLTVAEHDFLHDCDTQGGSSGSPVFRLEDGPDGRKEVALVGGHHSGFMVNYLGQALPGVVKLNRAVDVWRARAELPEAFGGEP